MNVNGEIKQLEFNENGFSSNGIYRVLWVGKIAEVQLGEWISVSCTEKYWREFTHTRDSAIAACQKHFEQLISDSIISPLEYTKGLSNDPLFAEQLRKIKNNID